MCSDNEDEYFAPGSEDEHDQEQTIQERECQGYFQDDDDEITHTTTLLHSQSQQLHQQRHQQQQQQQQQRLREGYEDEDYDSNEENKSIVDLLSQLDEFQEDEF